VTSAIFVDIFNPRQSPVMCQDYCRFTVNTKNLKFNIRVKDLPWFGCSDTKTSKGL